MIDTPSQAADTFERLAAKIRTFLISTEKKNLNDQVRTHHTWSKGKT
jgi:hypothetical protein